MFHISAKNNKIDRLHDRCRPWQIAYVRARRTRNSKFYKLTYLMIVF